MVRVILFFLFFSFSLFVTPPSIQNYFSLILLFQNSTIYVVNVDFLPFWQSLKIILLLTLNINLNPIDIFELE